MVLVSPCGFPLALRGNARTSARSDLQWHLQIYQLAPRRPEKIDFPKRLAGTNGRTVGLIDGLAGEAELIFAVRHRRFGMVGAERRSTSIW